MASAFKGADGHMFLLGVRIDRIEEVTAEIARRGGSVNYSLDLGSIINAWNDALAAIRVGEFKTADRLLRQVDTDVVALCRLIGK